MPKREAGAEAGLGGRTALLQGRRAFLRGAWSKGASGREEGGQSRSWSQTNKGPDRSGWTETLGLRRTMRS